MQPLKGRMSGFILAEHASPETGSHVRGCR